MPLSVITSDKAKQKGPNTGRKFDDEWRKNLSDAHKGIRVSEEAKKKIGKAMKGRVFTPEWRAKISKALMGKPGTFKGKRHTQEAKDAISRAQLGRPSTLKGVPRTEEVRRKISAAQKELVATGEYWNWKGGKTSENNKVRNSLEMRLWRDAVYKRDNFTCQKCKVPGRRLNADHIKSFAYHPELRLSLENGRTLCVPCHRKTDNYGYKSIKQEVV